MPRSHVRRGRHAALVAATLSLACAPVATHAQVIFKDDFDGSNSINRYNIYSFDSATSSTTVATGAVGDVAAAFQYNYGSFIYRHLTPDGLDPAFDPIPSAPHSTGGSTIGLRLDANNVGESTGGTAIINLLPKVTEFTGGVLPSGNYKLTVDVWMNYNGGEEGNGGSTEHMLAGINQQNPVAGNGLAGPVVTDPAVQQRGQTIAIDGERGQGNDYRIYTDNSRLGSTDPSTGYVAQSGAKSAANGLNPFYTTMFPSPTYETGGGIGKHWVTLEVKYVDNVVYYSIDAGLGGGMQLIAARTDLTSTSGNVAIGYADLIGGIADTEVLGPGTGQDANFVVFDNLSVEQLPASAPRPTWNTASGSWTTGSNWNNGTPNSSTAFAVFGASAAGSTVTVNSSVTVQEIDFDNAGMTIAGPGPLVMDSPGTTGGVTGTFNVKQGNQIVSAPVTVNKDLLFHVAQAGSSLTFTQPLSDSTYQFTKSGDGTVNLRGGRNGGMTVLGGKINLVPGSGTMVTNSILIVGPLTGVGQRGSIDINDNKLVLDYTGAVGSATSNIRSTIKGAFNGGNWSGQGLMSSLAVNDPQKIKGVGYWEASDLLGVTGSSTATWFGQSVDGTSLLMAVTYIGDLNFDGKVDGDDFALIDRSKLLYGVSTTVDPRGIAAGTAGWINGDLNYDGAINASDYALIDKTYGILHGLSPDFLAQREAEFGADYVASLVASVPEPTTLGLLSAASLIAAGRRRRP